MICLFYLGYSQTPKYVQIVNPQEGDKLAKDSDGIYRNFPREGFDDVFSYQDFWNYDTNPETILCVSKITVYADTIIVANPNTIIIWETK